MKIDIMKMKKPNKEQIDFFLKLETETMKHALNCMENNNYIEGYFYLWSLIEQLLVPQLIIFIANSLKINVPKFIFNSSPATTQAFYLALSHDNKLYNLLEKARKNRNTIVHEPIYNQKKEFNKKIEKNTIRLVTLWYQISRRLTGEEKIPVLTLYTNGWNDNRKRIIEVIKKWGYENGLTKKEIKKIIKN